MTAKKLDVQTLQPIQAKAFHTLLNTLDKNGGAAQDSGLRDVFSALSRTKCLINVLDGLAGKKLSPLSSMNVNALTNKFRAASTAYLKMNKRDRKAYKTAVKAQANKKLNA